MPAMPWRDVPAWVAEHLRGELNHVSRNALLFLILTAARSGEIRGATWKEFDFIRRVWVIPAERMKAGELHEIPLSDMALEILRRQQGMHETLVFPAPRAGKALSDMALTVFLRKHNAPSDTPQRAATAHGFRSSFRDWASANRYDRDLAEIALAHNIGNKVEGAYNRERLLDLRRPMMEAWADFVMGADSCDLGKVIPMRKEVASWPE